MAIELLGPLRVDGEGGSLQRRDQVVLSALSVQAGEVLSADQLAEALWGEAPPSSWPKQIHGCVLRLRRTLGAAAIETTGAGYRLTTVAELDRDRFEELIGRGKTLAVDGEFDRAAVAFGRALELWRGVPFDVLDGWSPGRIESARLAELRLDAEESLLDARLASGEHREVVAIAEASVAEQPLREHRWAILATALYRCGRQADALRALKHARQMLVEQLGIEPGDELVALEGAILRQDDTLIVAPAPPTISQHCPYKGLVPYDVADTETFFGRDSEVAACVDRLRASPMLVVTGPSGCGKSSLARAGLVPTLIRAGHAVVVFVPGSDPATAMTNALASSPVANPVLVVDQFEELFILDDDAAGRARSLCARLASYATGTAPVVVTVRADHVAALAVDDEFAVLAERGLHLVKALTGDSLRQAIQGPAGAVGLRLEPGLVDLLVRDCEGEPGALPLLSHALAETWQRRDGRVLTVEGYRATGEIRGAVARSADRLYESLPAEQRPKLRSMLLRLVAPSPDGEPVRSRVATRSLGGDADRDRVLRLLVHARLVTTEEDSVELAHEALARAWPRLRSWLDEDAAGQRVLRHLSTAADGWESLGRPSTELYRGARLESALEWRAATSPDLTDDESAFLEASVAEATTERQQLAEQARAQACQNRRLRRRLVAVAVLLVAALFGGVLALQQRQTARAEEREAALTALTSNAAALRRTRGDLAALLTVEAHRLAPSPATESALFGTFTAAPGLERVVDTEFEFPLLTNADVTLIPNSDTLAVNNGSGGVELLDTISGDRRQLEGPGDTEYWSRMAVAADGGTLATVWFAPPSDEETGTVEEPEGSGMLSVWNLDTGQHRFDPIRIADPPQKLAINQDGSLIAGSSQLSGLTRIYDGGSGDVLVEIEGITPPQAEHYVNPAQPAVFLPDGSLLIGSAAGPLRIFDPADGSEIKRIDAPPFTNNSRMWINDDGTSAVTVGWPDGGAAPGFSTVPANAFTTTTFDLQAGTRTDPVALDGSCNAMVYVEVTNALLCGTWAGQVLGFDVATGAKMPTRFDTQQGPVCGMALTHDGTTLFELASCTDGNAKIIQWRLDGGGPISRLVVDTPYPSYAVGFGVGGDHKALVAEVATEPDGQPTTHIIDTTSGEIIDRLPGVYGLLPTADPGVAVVVFDPEGTVGRYDVNRHESVGTPVDPGFEIRGIWSVGERVIVKGGEQDERLTALDLDAGQVVEPTIDAGEQIASDVGPGYPNFMFWVVAPTDEALYTVIFDYRGTGERRLQRRDPQTGAVLTESSPGIRNVAATNGVVIAATITGRIFEVDPITLEPVGLPFPGITGPASDLALDSRGERLMVRGDDETLRFYDVATRTPLGDPIDLDRFFTESSAVLRNDGLAAAAVTRQGVIVWDLAPDHWIDAACQIAGRNLTQAEWSQYIGDLAPYRSTCPDNAAA